MKDRERNSKTRVRKKGAVYEREKELYCGVGGSGRAASDRMSGRRLQNGGENRERGSAGDCANRMSELQSRDFYSEKARKFTVMECEATAFWPEFLDGIEGDLALYHQVWDEAIDIRAVYPKGDIAEPDLVSGRFLSEVDAFGEIPAAVVGRDFETSLIEKDGTFSGSASDGDGGARKARCCDR